MGRFKPKKAAENSENFSGEQLRWAGNSIITTHETIGKRDT